MKALIKDYGLRGIAIEIGTWIDDRWIFDNEPLPGFAFAETADVYVDTRYGNDNWEVSVSFASVQMDVELAERRSAIFAAATEIAKRLDNLITSETVGFDAVHEDAVHSFLKGAAKSILVHMEITH